MPRHQRASRIPKRLINNAMTTRSDLERLLSIEGIPAQIDWGFNFDRSVPYMVLNIGIPGILGGTHWVGVDNVHRRYFDPLGASPPTYIPANYEHSNIDVQDYRYGHCGQYVVLWLCYSIADEIDRFHNLFDDPNS